MSIFILFQNNFSYKKDYSNYTLQLHSEERNLWVSGDYHIFLETFSPIYKESCDFIIAIAEPRSRTKYIHEYELTQYSLYAAASMNINTQEIINVILSMY